MIINIVSETAHNLKLADKKLVKLKFSYLLVTINGIFSFKVFFKDSALGYKIVIKKIKKCDTFICDL